MSVTYYPINEDAARRAQEANSYRDYVPGSATAHYRSMVDKAVEIAERHKKHVDPMYHDKVDRLLGSYARRLADNLNASYAIDARVPSILITGGGNFPTAKKEKQNAARDRNMAEYQEIRGILQEITSVGTGGISSSDPNAKEKIMAKVEELEHLQERMKAANAYYRKHKTLDGCPALTEEQITKLKAAMSSDWRTDPKPFESYQLSNNNANIRRLRARIVTLEKEMAHAAEGRVTPIEGDGFTLLENTAILRIQFVFEDKPDADTRTLLKSHGFHWAPSEGAWQRLLNDSGRAAARAVVAALAKEA